MILFPREASVNYSQMLLIDARETRLVLQMLGYHYNPLKNLASNVNASQHGNTLVVIEYSNKYIEVPLACQKMEMLPLWELSIAHTIVTHRNHLPCGSLKKKPLRCWGM